MEFSVTTIYCLLVIGLPASLCIDPAQPKCLGRCEDQFSRALADPLSICSAYATYLSCVTNATAQCPIADTGAVKTRLQESRRTCQQTCPPELCGNNSVRKVADKDYVDADTDERGNLKSREVHPSEANKTSMADVAGTLAGAPRVGRSRSPGKARKSLGWAGVSLGVGGRSKDSAGKSLGKAGGSIGTAGRSPGTAGRSPGTAGRSPGTAGRSPGTAGRPPGTAGRSPGTAGRSPETAGRSPGTAGRSPGTAGRSPGTAGRSPRTAMRSSATAGRSPGTAGESGKTGRSQGSVWGSPGTARRSPGMEGRSIGSAGTAYVPGDDEVETTRNINAVGQNGNGVGTRRRNEDIMIDDGNTAERNNDAVQGGDFGAGTRRQGSGRGGSGSEGRGNDVDFGAGTLRKETAGAGPGSEGRGNDVDFGAGTLRKETGRGGSGSEGRGNDVDFGAGTLRKETGRGGSGTQVKGKDDDAHTSVNEREGLTSQETNVGPPQVEKSKIKENGKDDTAPTDDEYGYGEFEEDAGLKTGADYAEDENSTETDDDKRQADPEAIAYEDGLSNGSTVADHGDTPEAETQANQTGNSTFRPSGNNSAEGFKQNMLWILCSLTLCLVISELMPVRHLNTCL
ncbi:uncharacterized PE-PGRS family protein PE_PGRS36-like [Haliotis cracherodii]|uniref:uncharacterized PE-PGRS family protein PE_PGRS36-like n=1 Tax=Haliotis cracherodii TaxID=6455 RepID=UPI0039EC0A2D